jgi:6-phosphogluconolactonase/glucosamine-6-phosphate isomerase/deaminase
MQTDWSRWHVFMCDERHVQHTHDDCNFKYYKDNLVTKGLPLNMYPSNPDVDCKKNFYM